MERYSSFVLIFIWKHLVTLTPQNGILFGSNIFGIFRSSYTFYLHNFVCSSSVKNIMQSQTVKSRWILKSEIFEIVFHRIPTLPPILFFFLRAGEVWQYQSD